jgi:hypothetical protein
MNSGKTIFAQLMDFVPTYEFRKCVDRYNGNHKVISFSCWDQYLSMAFAQLTYRESLRDIQVCLRATQSRLYHLGIRGKISRNTLAHANQTRDWRIYADFAQILIARARKLYAADSFGIELDQAVYALDSTTIDLCLALFPWAEFRKRKGAVKLHTLLDLHGNIPSVVIITTGKVHDVNILDQLIIELGAIYIMDRGYLDFARLYKIHRAPAFFVTRTKTNFNRKRLYSQPVDKSTGIQCDQGVLCEKGLPGKTPTHPLLRFKEQQNSCVSDQQLSPAGHHDCQPLSLPMAGGVVFQVDQTAPQNQSFLWHHRECRQDSDLDRHLSLCSRGDREEDLESGPKSLHNSTDSECHPFRKRTNLSSTFKCQLHKSGRPTQQPIESIRLTLGQQ